MLRLWAESYSKKTPLETVATVVMASVVVHGSLIGAAVFATLPAAGVPTESIANRVFYIPPPDRTSGQRGSREVVRYVDLGRPGPSAGEGPPRIGNDRPLTIERSVGRPPPQDTVAAPETPPLPGPPDSVFSILEVDSAVVRLANSAAPAYPLKLLQAHITGAVAAQYVVDTTGFADSVTFKVMNSPNPEFVNAVRAALPYMRFQPAKIGRVKVRQLVEQTFTFRIATDTTVAPAKRKPPVAE